MRAECDNTECKIRGRGKRRKIRNRMLLDQGSDSSEEDNAEKG